MRVHAEEGEITRRVFFSRRRNGTEKLLEKRKIRKKENQARKDITRKKKLLWLLQQHSLRLEKDFYTHIYIIQVK